MVTVPPKDPTPQATQSGDPVTGADWNNLLDLMISDALVGVPAAQDQYPLVWNNANQRYQLAPGFTLAKVNSGGTLTQRKTIRFDAGTNMTLTAIDVPASDIFIVKFDMTTGFLLQAIRAQTAYFLTPSPSTTWANFQDVADTELFNSANYETHADLTNLQSNQMKLFMNQQVLAVFGLLKLQYRPPAGAWTDAGLTIDISSATGIVSTSFVTVPTGMRALVDLRLAVDALNAGIPGPPDPAFSVLGVVFQ